MEDKEQYKALMSEIIAKQAVILGPQIAVLKARNVKELVVADDGKVVDFTGEGQQVVEKLVDEYIAIAGLIVKNTLKSVFEKYNFSH